MSTPNSLQVLLDEMVILRETNELLQHQIQEIGAELASRPLFPIPPDVDEEPRNTEGQSGESRGHEEDLPRRGEVRRNMETGGTSGVAQTLEEGEEEDEQTRKMRAARAKGPMYPEREPERERPRADFVDRYDPKARHTRERRPDRSSEVRRHGRRDRSCRSTTPVSVVDLTNKRSERSTRSKHDQRDKDKDFRDSVAQQFKELRDLFLQIPNAGTLFQIEVPGGFPSLHS